MLHAKFWYYCTIEGCELQGTATLNSSFSIQIINKNTILRHIRGKRKSYQSRNTRGEKRKILAEKVADMAYPSKIYHRKLSALDEKSFSMGNLKDVPLSKSVITQCSYENRKENRIDESLITSLKILKSKYSDELRW